MPIPHAIGDDLGRRTQWRYYFSSVANRLTFIANPDAYLQKDVPAAKPTGQS
jgi:hypothetical protein